MNEQSTKPIVPNVVQFKAKYRAVVQQCVQAREQAGVTQEFLAEWLDIDRRKIIALEKFKKIDLQTLLLYADKFSVDLQIYFTVN